MFSKTTIVLFVFIGIVVVSFVPVNDPVSSLNTEASDPVVRKILLYQINDFQSYVRDSLYGYAQQEIVDEKDLQRRFLKARLLFKEFEWAVDYFTSDLARRLNGPPVHEIENADLLDKSMAFTIAPTGLQVIEEFIFPDYEINRKQEFLREIELLLTNTDYIVLYYRDVQLPGWRVLDAAKQEVFRIVSLGIAGFDNPLSLNSMEECATALNSLKSVLSFYSAGKRKSQMMNSLDSAITYLREHQDFESFDRAEFITGYANKISEGISNLQEKDGGYKIRYNRMLNQQAKTLFDSAAFNVNAFSPGQEYHITPERVVLGERLFFDVALSGTGTRSCASCHKPDLGFADGLTKNTNIHDTHKLISRNSPTLLNAALQSNYFYDMRALTLEDQAKAVIANPDEMDGSMENILQYLSKDESYREMFRKAFPEKGSGTIQSDEVTNALASYIRSLTKLNSRFDDYMRGDKQSLTQQELKGFNLFMGKAKCATCHFVPLFSGIMPPKYITSETEVIGVPLSLTDSVIDPDRGYYDIIGIDYYKNAFKTPTLRNVDKTAPYMHNGIYTTLEQVMDFYNNAGAVGLKIDLPNKTLSEEKLNLTNDEINDIIAFMRSLNSK